MRSPARPPKHVRGEEFDLWCAEMVWRGYSVSLLAANAGVSRNSVMKAVERVESGRYGEPREAVGVMWTVKKRPQPESDWEIEERRAQMESAARLVERGAEPSEAARAFGVSPSGLRDHLRKKGRA